MTRKKRKIPAAETAGIHRRCGQCAFGLHMRSRRATACNMAERAGFEPAAGAMPDTILAGWLLIAMLGHLSKKRNGRLFLENLPTSLVESNHNLESAS